MPEWSCLPGMLICLPRHIVKAQGEAQPWIAGLVFLLPLLSFSPEPSFVPVFLLFAVLRIVVTENFDRESAEGKHHLIL
jgi:hypothetical protein